jgi:hypothetical protein
MMKATIMDIGGRWRSQNHRAGHGLMGEYVDVRGPEVFYAGILLGTLEQMRV